MLSVCFVLLRNVLVFSKNWCTSTSISSLIFVAVVTRVMNHLIQYAVSFAQDGHMLVVMLVVRRRARGKNAYLTFLNQYCTI